MMDDQKQYQDRIERLYGKLREEARQGGYHLNPDIEFTKDLVEGLLINEDRYGYQSCPCRLSSGTKQGDIDIICPCDYRDADVVEHDACYCGLYVSKSVVDGEKKLTKVPERRPPADKRRDQQPPESASPLRLPLPIWRCRVCGYLCARDNPPEVCPICKAKSDRFEKFLDKT
jgi:ferredoxin-thioredoxin reductase catalytic subunit